MKDRFNIVLEDDQVLVVDKPAGLVVNRSETIKEGTLQDQLAVYFNLPNSDLGIGDRAGIVHRLDRETSGLLLVAKTQTAFDFLQTEFYKRRVKKEYTALVHGHLKEKSGIIGTPILRVGNFGKFGIARAGDREARQAQTDFKKREQYRIKEEVFEKIVAAANLSKGRQKYLAANAKDYTLLSLFPKTGRTHQIRVHLKSIGHPVVSDLLYTPRKLLKFDLLWCPRLFLHASELEFKHPRTGKTVKFESDLPNDLKESLRSLTIDPTSSSKA